METELRHTSMVAYADMPMRFNPPSCHMPAKQVSHVLLSLWIGHVGCALADPVEAPIMLAQAGTPYTNELFLAPFKYVAPKINPATSGASDEVETPKRPPNEQRIVDLNTAGDYAKAGSEGLALIAAQKPDDGLQLIIANSLAWSGRLKEATATYQRITEETLVDDANVGIANILRWQGRDEVAAPMYRGVLTSNPDHIDAKNGLDLAEREIAPRTAITFGGTSDSSQVQSRTMAVAHRWRDDSGYRIYEVEAAAVRESLPDVEAPLQEVTMRYQDVGVELRPTLELTLPTNIKNSLFGNLRLQFDEDRAQFDVGRVNWGKYSTNANSLLARETATHVGFSIKRAYELGDVSAKVDYFNISDDNTVVSSDVRLTSAIRPFGNNVKPYLGVETRKATFTSPNYWSPTEGAGSLYGGLSGEWPWENWSAYGGIQAGLGLYGEAGSSWMLSGGAKYWVTSNYALSVNLWGMTSVRGGSEYRSHAANVILEKIWR